MIYVFNLIWERFWSSNLPLFNVMFRRQCVYVWLFVVYNFCWYFCLLRFHICSIISFLRICFTAIFMIFLCLLIYLVSMWFWWLTISVIDDFMIVTDVADLYVFVSVIDVADFYFITLYLKRLYRFDSNSLYLTRII